MHAIFKPHHFLDFLYDIAKFNGVLSTVSPYGHAYGACANLLAAGKVDTVTFTSGADDTCKPCRKLKDGVCSDIFPPETAARYGVDRKYDYNLKMDLRLMQALPEVFSPDVERSIDDVYALLREKLTPEIILLNWPQPNRPELTLRGLDMAIRARAGK